jgi:asparagine synthase (glutamine-hydrolysing)
VGAALSGGIDSSALVAAMRHLEPGMELHTFSYVADDPRVSEGHWAEMAGSAARARMHTVTLGADDLVGDLDRLIQAQDEPFGSTSIYAQYRVFGAARQAGIKVMLDGQGADEILGGYPMYTSARLASLVRQGKLREARAFLRAAGRLPGRERVWYQAGQFFIPAALQGPFRRMVGESLAPGWMNGSWFTERGVRMQPLRGPGGREILRAQLRDTVTTTSLPALLRYEDRNSMAHSVESRVPFLTPEFVQLVMSLPEEYLIAPDGTTKAVLRRALRGLVPDAILDRSDKVGFATPERGLLTGLSPWVEQVLGSETAAAIPALRRDVMLSEWREVRDGRRRFDFRVWRWLNLIRWAEHTGAVFA